MEQLVILVLIGLISLINWIVQKSAEVREKRKLAQAAEKTAEPEESFFVSEEPSTVTEASQPEPVSSDSSTKTEESMKNLMEALGFEVPELPEPEELTPPPLPSSLEQMAAEMEATRSGLEKAPVRPARPRAPKPRVSKPRRSRTRVGALLTAPGGLRNGIVLAEILGPPKSLQ